MKSRHLVAFIPPVVEQPVCRCCKTFAPDCLAPVGEGALPMCWWCAHHVVEHGAPVEYAHRGECECLPTEVFPWRALGATDEEREAHVSAFAERRRVS